MTETPAADDLSSFDAERIAAVAERWGYALPDDEPVVWLDASECHDPFSTRRMRRRVGRLAMRRGVAEDVRADRGMPTPERDVLEIADEIEREAARLVAVGREVVTADAPTYADRHDRSHDDDDPPSDDPVIVLIVSLVVAPGAPSLPLAA